RQGLGLLVIDHLQPVLDRAQEAIGRLHLVARDRLDPAVVRAQLEPAARVALGASSGWAASRSSVRSVSRPRSAGLRPPAISCWVCAKNSISRMPPRPRLMLCPFTAISALPR